MRGRPHLTMLAGWLFADLFLVLLLTGLASIPAKSGANPNSTAGPSASPSVKPGLDRDHIDFDIEISPASYRAGGKNRLVAAVTKELAHRNPEKLPVGFVLIFASGPPGGAGQAEHTANDAVSRLIRKSAPFKQAVGLGYWSGSGDHFEFKIFLLR